jgi:hypothetical protein
MYQCSKEEKKKNLIKYACACLIFNLIKVLILHVTVCGFNPPGVAQWGLIFIKIVFIRIREFSKSKEATPEDRRQKKDIETGRTTKYKRGKKIEER